MKTTRLQRRTPLRTRKPWRPTRKAWRPTRKPWKRKRWAKWKRKKLHDWPAMMEFLQERSGGYCERRKCKRRLIGGVKRTNVHHIKKRSAGGTDDPENVCALCGPEEFWGKRDYSCHTWTEEHPVEARKEGWLK